MKGRLIAVAAVAGAVSLAACGGSSEDDEVGAVVEKWFASIADRDYKAGCELLTASAQKKVQEAGFFSDSCEDALRSLTDGWTDAERVDLKRIRVRDVKRSGDKVEVGPDQLELPPELDEVGVTDGEPAVLRRVDGRWRLDRVN